MFPNFTETVREILTLANFLKLRGNETFLLHFDRFDRRITPAEMLRNVRRAFETRLYHCQAALGAQFEHLI